MKERWAEDGGIFLSLSSSLNSNEKVSLEDATTFSIMTLSIMTLSIVTINDTQHYDTLNNNIQHNDY